MNAKLIHCLIKHASAIISACWKTSIFNSMLYHSWFNCYQICVDRIYLWYRMGLYHKM